VALELYGHVPKREALYLDAFTTILNVVIGNLMLYAVWLLHDLAGPGGVVFVGLALIMLGVHAQLPDRVDQWLGRWDENRPRSLRITLRAIAAALVLIVLGVASWGMWQAMSNVTASVGRQLAQLQPAWRDSTTARQAAASRPAQDTRAKPDAAAAH